MTQEDKNLLLQDLCGRLSYGVKVQTPYSDAFLIGIIDRKGYKKDERYIDAITDRQTYPIRYVKPYLRPLSSMTEEEKHYIDNRWGADNYGDIITYSSYEGGMSTVELADIIGFQDWLNAHHFDFRRMIEKDLAIEAPEGMYK